MNFAYVVIPGGKPSKRIGIVTFGESGYHLTNYDHHTTVKGCEEHVRLINERMGITPEVEEAMLCGSMYGWNIPGAEAARLHFASRESLATPS
ncbi:hypothetical protein [Tunturiibacter gelidiferens]|uniref:hypothetical protein n=1 Tax=Tunturiibacter gelidiferens TaxID=3069689 RepID=UPI003D9B0DD6